MSVEVEGWWSWECEWCSASIRTADVSQALQFVDAHHDAHDFEATDDELDEDE